MKKNIIIGVLGLLLLLGSILFIVFNRSEECSTDTVDNSSNNTTSTNDTNDISNFVSGNGKVRVKRNGKISIEDVPSGVVGKYVGESGEEYITLKSDGTFSAYLSTGEGLRESSGYFDLNYLPGSELLIELVGISSVKVVSASTVTSDISMFESIFSVPGSSKFTKG